jgi:hypothetical protein
VVAANTGTVEITTNRKTIDSKLILLFIKNTLFPFELLIIQIIYNSNKMTMGRIYPPYILCQVNFFEYLDLYVIKLLHGSIDDFLQKEAESE